MDLNIQELNTRKKLSTEQVQLYNNIGFLWKNERPLANGHNARVAINYLLYLYFT